MKNGLWVLLAFAFLTEGVAHANIAPPWQVRRVNKAPDSLSNWFKGASAVMATQDMKAAKSLCDARFYSSRRATPDTPTLEELFAEGIRRGFSLSPDLTELWEAQLYHSFIVRTDLLDADRKVVRVVYLFLQGEEDLQEGIRWAAVGVARTRFDAVQLVRRTYERNRPADTLD